MFDEMPQRECKVFHQPRESCDMSTSVHFHKLLYHEPIVTSRPWIQHCSQLPSGSGLDALNLTCIRDDYCCRFRVPISGDGML